MSLNNKRIGYELMDLVNYCGPINIETQHGKHMSDSKCIITLVLLNLKVDFILDNRYPFAPPAKVFVNSKDYIRIVNESIPKLYRIGLEIGCPQCFCCSSLLCADRWSTQVQLTRLYSEIEDVILKKQKIMHIYFCRQIACEKLTHDIPIEYYL